MLNILYEDRELIVVEKPSGVEAQSSGGFAPDMVSLLQNYIMSGQKGKKGKISTELSTDRGKLSTKQVDKQAQKSVGTQPPYIAVIHRLDKPVSGVMVYAKTRKAAAGLSRQLRDGAIGKTYLAVICGKPVDNVGNFVDHLRKEGKTNCSVIVDKADPEGKRAALTYQVLQTVQRDQELTLVRIHLETGRHHQIRVQFAGRGLPLWGDNRYNPDLASGKRRGTIALCAWKLSFTHPVSGKKMDFQIDPKEGAFAWFDRKMEGDKGRADV